MITPRWHPPTNYAPASTTIAAGILAPRTRNHDTGAKPSLLSLRGRTQGSLLYDENGNEDEDRKAAGIDSRLSLPLACPVLYLVFEIPSTSPSTPLSSHTTTFLTLHLSLID